jgi:addiction module HigA family antidote
MKRKMKIHKHLHPGEILKNIFDMSGINITVAAKMLGVTRVSLSRLFNGHIGISPEMAARLSIAFNTSIERWTALQSCYDAWFIGKKLKTIAKQVTPINKLKKSGANLKFKAT